MSVYETTALDTALEFDTTNADSKCVVRITGTNKVLMAWYQSTTLVYVQAFTVNTSTGAISAIGSPVDIEAGTAGNAHYGISITLIDASNAIVFWIGSGDDGFCQLISIDGTGNCATNGSSVEYDTLRGRFPSSCLMSSTRILNIWHQTNGAAVNSGRAQIFTVDTGAGTITPEGSSHDFTGDLAILYTSLKKLSSTKALAAYRGLDGDGYAIILDINTTTWAVTSAGAVFEFIDAVTITGTSVAVMDDAGSPMKAVIGYTTSAGSAIVAVQINTTTWAITLLGSAQTVLAGGTGDFGISIASVDSTHILIANNDVTNTDMKALVHTYDATTGMGTATANTATLTTTSTDFQVFMCDFTDITGGFVACWSGLGNDGFIQTLQVDLGGGSATVTFLPQLAMLGVG